MIRTIPLILIVFVSILSFSQGRDARACQPEDGVWGLSAPEEELFGTPEGFVIRLNAERFYLEPRPAVLGEVHQYLEMITLTPHDQPEAFVTGVVTPVDGVSGVFVWRPDDGVELSVGRYDVTIKWWEYPPRESVLTLTVIETEPFSSYPIALTHSVVDERQRNEREVCCRTPAFEACVNEYLERGPICGNPGDYCDKVCWVESYVYNFQFVTNLSWPVPAHVRSMTYGRLIGPLLGNRLLDPQTPGDYRYQLEEMETAPEEICAQVVMTHLITGEEVTSEEVCISSRAYQRVPHLTYSAEDYTEAQLNDWLSCTELTDHQRSILSEVNLLPESEEGGQEVAGQEVAGQDGSTYAGDPEPSEREVNLSEEGCQQHPVRLHGWLLLLCLLVKCAQRTSERFTIKDGLYKVQ